MNSDQSEFNLKCAKLLGRYYPTKNINDEDTTLIDDYYNDANDRNKVIEKLWIKTSPLYDEIAPPVWWCTTRNHPSVSYIDKSMEQAQNKCIEQCLMALVVSDA